MKASRWLTPLALLLVLNPAVLNPTRAAEQTAEERKWDVVVAGLVDAITRQSDMHSISDLFAPNAFIAPFEMNRTESFTVLPTRLPAGRIVSAHGYIHPSVSCASDIVSDLAGNGTIDAQTMRKLSPENEGDLRKADSTMARWFEAAIEAKSGDPIAVLVIYDDGKAEPPHAPQLSFVLLRGETLSNGQPRIVRALYGTMQSAVK